MFMELPVSGLHRLFHTATASSQSLREKASLEALTEDAHTFDLLYPTYEALLNAQHNIFAANQPDPAAALSTAISYDVRRDLDLQSSRDIRVIIAQDGNAIAQQPRLLYDSHHLPSPQPLSDKEAEGGRGKADNTHGAVKSRDPSRVDTETPSHPSRLSHPILDPHDSPSPPEHGRQSAFWSTLPRRASGRSSANERETTHARLAREGREERDALLACMFGHTGLPLVSSTKLHINPPRSAPARDAGLPSGLPDPASARPFPKRRTPLTRSMTAEEFQGSTTGPQDKMQPPGKGPSILVTRLFPVELEKIVFTTGRPQSPEETASDDQIKQIKVPRYGVAILIQLPPSKRQISTSVRLPQRSRLGSSYEEPLHIPLLAEGWNRDSIYSSNSNVNVIDQDIERVVAHWSVLTRVVSLLEAVARSAISSRLQGVCRNGPVPFPQLNESRSPSKPSTRQKKHKEWSQLTVQLPNQALQDCIAVAQCAKRVCERVVSALRLRRAVTGQGRWGIWREEARWAGRWAGGKAQNFFLFNLLTAFLGNHMDWLDALCRGRSELRRGDKVQRETDIIKHRTVIIAADKMAARRLIFLLSAFLPPSYHLPQVDLQGRSFSSRSSTVLSQSPPTGIPIPREKSLRRTINRKPRTERNGSLPFGHRRSISFTVQNPPYGANATATASTAGRTAHGHSRRTSDAHSIRSLALPMPTSQPETRKSSIATLSTMTPDCIAVPQFASPPSNTSGTAAAPRPGSSGSLASLSLQRTLSRSESVGESLSPASPSASRWGSMLSGFWSVRRGSSTDHTDPLGTPPEGLGISGMQYSSSPSSLAKMVEELDDTESTIIRTDSDRETSQSQGPFTAETAPKEVEVTAARDIPERAPIEEFPMKLSVDTNDGVIDIDLPATNSYSSSFDSCTSSPKAPNTASSSFNDHSSTYGHTSHRHHASPPANPSPAVDVAGYLKTYHEDFALQAVRPYKNLKQDVRATMHAANSFCTTLMADTTTFSITRLTHRPPSQSPQTNTNTKSSETNDADIIEEPLMDLDPTLITAVERIIAPDNHPQPSLRHPSFKDQQQQQQHVSSRSECHALVMGALEKVVQSVSAELAEGKAVEPDSTLREGVRRWLEGR